MNNQEQLNSVSLEEASRLISSELIKMKFKLDENSKVLQEKRKSYENDYIIASADGDARENAPLEAAIQNLKLVTGEISNNIKLLNIIDNLEDADYLIGVYDYTNVIMHLEDCTPEQKSAALNALGITDVTSLVEKIKSYTVEELSALIAALEDLKVEVTDTWCSFLDDLDEVVSVKSLPRYNSCGIIVPYTTVRLDLEGEIMTYRIYPNGVSFIDIGVMAGDSKLATALLGRYKGDIVNLKSSFTGQALSYKILDIY